MRFNARDPEEIYSHELCSNRTKVDKINIIAVVFKCLADLPDNFAASAPVVNISLNVGIGLYG
jgi:hypothetical protein